MAQFKPSRSPRNPITQAAHRRQALLQVFLPLTIGILVILGLALAAAVGPSMQASRFADISLVWLSLFYLVFALIFLVVLLAVVIGLAWLLRNLPIYTRKAHDLFTMIRVAVGRITDKVVEPFLRVHSFTAGLKGFRHK